MSVDFMRSIWNKQRKGRGSSGRGFTIVELLIVIVVIGILASITVVAFNGVQDRAKTARLASAVDVYAKALTAYKNEHGVYPSTLRVTGGVSNLDTVCLGDNYPARNGFPEGYCYKHASESLPQYRVNAGLSAAIEGYLSSQPDTSDLLTPDQSSRGMWYSSAVTNSTMAHINYRVRGDQTCARGTKVSLPSDGGSTQCRLMLN